MNAGRLLFPVCGNRDRIQYWTIRLRLEVDDQPVIAVDDIVSLTVINRRPFAAS